MNTGNYVAGFDNQNPFNFEDEIVYEKCDLCKNVLPTENLTEHIIKSWKFRTITFKERTELICNECAKN